MWMLCVALVKTAQCVSDKKSLAITVILLFIEFCDPAITCNGQGICTIDGTCKCDPVFYGETCLSKLRKTLC